MTKQEMIHALMKGLKGKTLTFGFFLFLGLVAKNRWEFSWFLGLLTMFVLIYGSDLILGLISLETGSSKKDND